MNEPAQTSAEPAVERPHRSRPLVLRRLLQLYDQPGYLEVGVSTGATFHELTAARQVAVDPGFRFDVAQARLEHPHATYHEVPSDEFFGRLVGVDERFDVIYLDGLHTFEQTLRDLTNALAHLQPLGVIVIDDVRPASYHASLPNHREAVRVRSYVGDTSKAWMGDVYRLLWFVDTFFPSLTYRTIADNHGQAVLWRQRRQGVTERTVREVAELSFGDLALDEDTRQERPFRAIRLEVEQMIQRGGGDPRRTSDDEH